MIERLQLGWNNVEWNNNSVAKMPHISKLYKEGVGLNQHYVQRWYPSLAQPVITKVSTALHRCTPTRASLMTGRYIHRIGRTNQPVSVLHYSCPFRLDPVWHKVS